MFKNGRRTEKSFRGLILNESLDHSKKTASLSYM